MAMALPTRARFCDPRTPQNTTATLADAWRVSMELILCVIVTVSALGVLVTDALMLEPGGTEVSIRR